MSIIDGHELDDLRDKAARTEKAEAEIERLRAALTSVIEEADDPAWGGSHCSRRVRMIAAAALRVEQNAEGKQSG